MRYNVRIDAGLRVGFWAPGKKHHEPFECVGHYNGPFLGDVIIGSTLEQELMEGTLRFSVGVLFRPDLGKSQRCETILILVNHVPEMFDYEDWESATG